MMKLTRQQRIALKAVFDRHPLFVHVDLQFPHSLICRSERSEHVATYRQFRKTVRPELCGYGAAMVPWCGMWLGIEKDGHTHS